MNEQDIINLNYAVARFGRADRRYEFIFGGGGAIIYVYDTDDKSLVGEVWGFTDTQCKAHYPPKKPLSALI